MKVAILGAGYVGLVSGVCLAAKGHEVVCVDKNPAVVDKLNAGEPTIHERGLPELLGKLRASKAFSATTDLAAALDGAEVAIIAVGTPSEDGKIDLGYVRSASREIGTILAGREQHLSVIVKSTVIPGTTDTVVRAELETASGKTHPAFGLGMNPEFLREGEAIDDFMFPDRIVLGHEDEATLKKLRALYAPWDVDKVECNTRTAEMIKYANNCLLATQISAVNEIANLAAAVGGIDVMDVMNGVHLDKRWNPIQGTGRANPAILSYLIPGCGFGGSCFPKDVQALRTQGQDQGLPMSMLNAVLSVNDTQPGQVTQILSRALGDLSGRHILLLGLAFKPETDDVRESASLKIAADLLSAGARVSAHDPIAVENFRRSFGADADKVDFLETWEAAARDCDAIVVATKWDAYRTLADLDLGEALVFDARRMLEKSAFATGRYLSIGTRQISGTAAP